MHQQAADKRPEVKRVGHVGDANPPVPFISLQVKCRLSLHDLSGIIVALWDGGLLEITFLKTPLQFILGSNPTQLALSFP